MFWTSPHRNKTCGLSLTKPLSQLVLIMSVIKSLTFRRMEIVSSSRTELHDCVCMAMVPFMPRASLRGCSENRATELCPACNLDDRLLLHLLTTTGCIQSLLVRPRWILVVKREVSMRSQINFCFCILLFSVFDTQATWLLSNKSALPVLVRPRLEKST